jgi:hypothetical protein
LPLRVIDRKRSNYRPSGAKHIQGFISERFDSHPVSTAGKKSGLRPALKPTAGLNIITLFPRFKPLIFVDIPEER